MLLGMQAIALAAVMTAQSPQQSATLVVENARVYTGVAGSKPARAIMAAGSRILYVGDDPSRWAGAGVRHDPPLTAPR